MTALADHADAARLARAAGNLLMRLRDRAAAGAIEIDGLGREGDRRSNRLLIELLGSLHPHDPVLSEESADDLRRLGADRVWVIDPLDGTREYTELDRSDWAVHVALVIEGTPVAAAVALPAQHRVLSTVIPPHLPARVSSRIRLVVSRTRPPAIAEALAAELDAELVPMGSAGAKTMAILLGEADVYAHGGGQYEWDSAAPAGVAAAAGLHATRLDGSPLIYNNPSPWLPDLLVCRPELADDVHEAVDRVLTLLEVKSA
ncbi:MAG: inositol monophosphatase family protein [Acidimicrobiales bacterium]